MVRPQDLWAQNGHSRQFRLNEIKVFGNERFDESEIGRWFNFKNGDAISKDILRQRSVQVLERMKERGYYFASIDSIVYRYLKDSSQADLHVHVDEGEVTRVDVVSIEGLPNADRDLSRDLRTKPGDVFDQALLQADIKYIIDYFEQKGYPYCKIEISELRMLEDGQADQGNLHVALEVDPGPKVTIGEIEIQGNEETKNYVIIREAGLTAGEVYDQHKIDKVVPKLMKLGYFKWVNPPKLRWLGNGLGKLIIELAEGNNNRFDGVIGYNPPEANRRGFVTGLVDISFRNLLGTGRQIEVHWERRSEQTQELQFRYVEPWVAGFPIHVGISFEQLIQDTSYVQRDLGLDFRWRFNENLAFISEVSKRDVSPDSLGRLKFGIPRSSSINLAVGLDFNTVDYLRNPTKGVHYQTSFEWGRKDIDPISDTDLPEETDSFNQRRLSIDFETYVSPFRWQVFAIGVHGRRITSDEAIVPITEQYRFGGTRTLRGYREEQFRGSRIAWANVEYRYLLNRDSRLFVFLDAGYFFREELLEETPTEIEDAKFGFGFGLRLDTKLGYFGIDYGLGEGDGLSNGKVHIGLTNAF
ncbi:BamA/TamA family outer membrane protein [candidate division KSB1 bacterium]|nr:BamA/TamA family outer membrane protein [candidate division KSB1 bacterium]NIR68469.1 BamA/TamA family outer membrane protein [candidate division KSB1 bacterium]NIS25120.1 BamA/TamA family outer membrane protein [candidate division KSB1 bacterium]NIT72032.1 BamA/TamA family outer membrane protein [candidate division KSB1 bacterium]NIU25819.1 BamA/TamA family outer membrane protein [candidate division KSB1 bacterium]